MTRDQIIRLAVVAVALAAIPFSGCSAPGRFVVKLSQQQVQQRMDKRFPVGVRKLVFEVRLERPAVSFVRGGRVNIGVSVVGLVAAMPVGKASAVITGRVRYDADRHEFQLTDPRVESLDVSHMPVRYTEHARRAVDQVAATALPAVPLYRLDPHRHRVARLMLKRAWICDARLCLEMGL